MFHFGIIANNAKLSANNEYLTTDSLVVYCTVCPSMPILLYSSHTTEQRTINYNVKEINQEGYYYSFPKSN